MTIPQTDMEPVADAAMDAKLREIWSLFPKRWMRNEIRQVLPPTRAHVMGCDFILHPRDNFTEFRMWEHNLPPEHEATAAIADRLAGRDAVIVDVGANAGAFFLPVLKRAGGGARALVFEPNPDMRARLVTNIDLNGLRDRVTVFDCAVSDCEAKSGLYLPRNGNLGQARVQLDYGDKGSQGGVEVDIRPLADCLAEAGVTRVDFLKVDVEGLEDRVLDPFLNSATAPRPGLIYFEVEHSGAWTYPLLQTLEQAGYAEEGRFDNNRLFARTGEGA